MTGLGDHMPQRLFVYKLTHDNGAAPCVDGDELLTLAICKPLIRKTARLGDLIFGFAANSLSRDNRLIYIARVTAVELDGDYYDKVMYEHRPDRIYIRGDDGHFSIRSDARFHEDGTLIRRDIGLFPEYAKARVLISDDFRYFGSAPGAPAVELGPYPQIIEMIRSLGQGHRVNHPRGREDELRRLQRDAWSYPVTVVGSPRKATGCGRGDEGPARGARSGRGCG